MSKVGSWGKIVFEVSRAKLLSFNNFSRSVETRWNEHEIIGKKPKSEFAGPGLDNGSLEIVLDAQLGIKPMDTLNKIEKAVEKGTANYLIIGKNKIGSGKWIITKISEEFDKIYANGAISKIKLIIDIKEYR